MFKKNQNISLLFSGGLFFFAGLMLVLNSILIPYIKDIHALSYSLVNLIPFTFYFSYFVGSLFSSFFLKKQSFLFYIKAGILIEIIASLLMICEGDRPPFTLVLISSMFLGIGVALMEVYGNLFLAKLGPESSLSQRLTLGHAATAFGMICAPLLGSWLLLNGQFLNIYQCIVGFGIILLFTSSFLHEEITSSKADKKSKNIKLLFNKIVIFGFLGIATSVGIETCCASFMVDFFSSHPQLNLEMSSSGNLSVIFWILLLIGRLVTPLFLYFFKEETILKGHAYLGIFLTMMVIYGNGILTLISLLGLGYAISIFFPLIYSLTLKRSDTNSNFLSGILCMGNIGGAFYPFTQGIIADHLGIQLSFFIVIFAFLFLLYYIHSYVTRKNEKFYYSTLDF